MWNKLKTDAINMSFWSGLPKGFRPLKMFKIIIKKF